MTRAKKEILEKKSAVDRSSRTVDVVADPGK
jgi:hypothetical protein